MLALGNVLRLSSVLNASKSVGNILKPNGIPIYNPVSGVKTIEERLGLPPRPKKPLTPYFRFLKEFRPKVTAENPKARLQDIVKIVTAKWEAAGEKTKKKLQDDYKKEQMAYIETRAKYESKLTDGQLQDLKQLKKELSEAKERRAAKKKLKELEKPKKPASAYLRFLTTERKLTSPSGGGIEKYRDWMKKATEKWAHVPEDEKRPYFEESRLAMETYKKELSAWESKMINLGYVDVVRHETIINRHQTPSEPKSKKNITKTE